MRPNPAKIFEVAGQALGLAGQVADLFGRRPLRSSVERAAVLRTRASRKRVAAGRAVTARTRTRRLRRAEVLEAEADRLDPSGKGRV